ncbi:MAG: Asp-tRNA(Asn)/Glu-tRNA(Gln) amidotransferase subunit GatC [Chloroflexi bacterium]|nr:Asp-tRNA(Asn)/Glu-tRNA(Gln) amidotransferase subunit GatC [Chloroflexota bacterium]
MALSREEVEHIAVLARVGLSEADVEKFREQLSHIIEHFEVLRQVDTEGVPPMAHSVALENVTRPDEPSPSLSADQILANAPEKDEGFFKVHAVLE